MGSSLEEIEEAVRCWSPVLVDPSFSEGQLRCWLMKEYPRHRVAVDPFAISRFPVTNEQFRRFVRCTGVEPPESLVLGEPHGHPVWGVSYDDACLFCAWLSAETETSFRLPTEREWEYAARGPSELEYPYGDHFDASCCNTAEAGIGHTTPVDRYPNGASGWGVIDMAGNVEEWTAGVYRPYPGGTAVYDHLAAQNGWGYRVLRGGNFARGGDLARCARRHGPHSGLEYRYRGFRIVAYERLIGA